MDRLAMHPTPALTLDLRTSNRRLRRHHLPKAAAGTIAVGYVVLWLSAVALAQGFTPLDAAPSPPVTVAAASAAAPVVHASPSERSGPDASTAADVTAPADLAATSVAATPKAAAPVDPPLMTVKPSTPSTASDYAFLDCIRYRESRGNYRALNPSGAAGAYQLMPVTAREVARRAGRTDLAATSVLDWSPADQDLMALVLYQWRGAAPWGGRC
jgi:hypothetical protein